MRESARTSTTRAIQRAVEADPRHAARLAASLVAVAVGSSLLVAGCRSPADPPPPASGGEEFHLSFETFETEVEPVLVAKGCDTAGDCHGGGIRGTYELSPADAKDVAFDFEQTRLQVTPYSPAESPILTKPLATEAGGAPHSFKAMPSTDDPSYRAILGWILAGEFR
jgi:hypothetical protein